MFVKASLSLLVGAMLIGAARPDVPTPGLPATHGEVKLKFNFLPDPYLKYVQAGGSIKTTAGGVKAYVAKAPDFKLFYTAGTYPLTFRVESDADTTLLINLPTGGYVANDDSSGKNPMIHLPKPHSGRYDIWVGTFNPTGAPAKLYISEHRPPGVPAPTPSVDLGVTFFNMKLDIASFPAVRNEFIATIQNNGSSAYTGGKTWKLHTKGPEGWHYIASDKIPALKVGASKSFNMRHYLNQGPKGPFGVYILQETYNFNGRSWKLSISPGDAQPSNDYRILNFVKK